jgi:hypothetical protein
MLIFIIRITDLYKFLDIIDLKNILTVNRNYNKLNNIKYDYIWEYHCILKFNKDFWIKAKELNKNGSLNNYYNELKRIIQFESKIKKLKLPLWDIEDYYNWWEINSKI